MNSFAALIIDIKGSTQFSDDVRNKIQVDINNSIDSLNEIFKKSIIKKVDFSAGDEVQGLFECPAAAYMFFRLLELLLSPVEMRGGIGIGAWTTRIADKGTQAQDGPAYHLARKSILDTHRMKTQRIRLSQFDKENILPNILMNASWRLLSLQSTKQRFIMQIIELLFPLVDMNLMTKNAQGLLLDMIGQLIEKTNKSEKCFTSTCNGEIVNLTDIITDPEEPEKLVTIRGASEMIASIFGYTRQNIDNQIRSGNILQIRCLDIGAIRVLKTI